MSESSGTTAFDPGDLLVGATLLNDPADDHRGQGRILRYGADLREKPPLLLPDTTHLVGGLKFDAAGRLWAFDSTAAIVLIVHRDGRIERRDFGGRPFSHVNFAADGSFYLGEHLVGSVIRPEVAPRLHTRIPFMRGTNRFGDGHVFHYSANGTLLREYATETHGGMAGFLGVTMAALSPDGRTLVYCSETGPRLMRYDLAGDRQLPDLQSVPPGQRDMFFSMAYAPDGVLFVLRSGRIELVDPAGATLRSIPLEGAGWALMILSHDARHAFVGNFFTGEIVKLELATGARTGVIQTGVARSVAGLAECP